MGLREIEALFADKEDEEKVLIDVKSVLDADTMRGAGYRYWRL